MKRIILIGLLLLVQIYANCVMSQSLSDSDVSQMMSLISDSIDIYQNKGDNKKVLSICENGIALLSKNEHLYTPASCILCLEAGKASMQLKDYFSAKFYFYRSFVLDELGDFKVESYSQIIKAFEQDSNIHYFKKLLDLAKSDTIYLNKLASDPSELCNQFNTTAWDCYNKGEFSSALDYFEMEINLLDALGETGNDNYLSIIPCEVGCLNALGNYELSLSHADYYLSLINTFKGENTVAYAYGLKTKADVYRKFGNGTESIILYKEALSLYEKYSGKFNLDYIRCLDGLALAYQLQTGSMSKTIEIELEEANLINNTPEAMPSDQAHIYGLLSKSYFTIGDKLKGIEFAEKQVNVLEKNNNTNDYDYASALSNLSYAYNSNNSYDKAIEISKKAIEIYSKLDLDETQKKLRRHAISSLSYSYFESGNIEQAISVINSILTSDIPDDENKLSDLQRLSTYYQRQGKNDLMKNTIERSLQLAEVIGGKQSEEYANALIYAACIQEKKGDAIIMLQQAADIFAELQGVNSEGYQNAQKALALFGVKPRTGVTRSKLDELKNQYGVNSTRYFNEYVTYLWSLGDQYQESNDIDMLYKTTLELDSLSQVIYSTFSKKEECYIFTRHNLAELVVGIFDLCLDANFYNSSVDIQKEVVSASLSIYGEDNIKYINEVEHLAKIMNHLPYTYFYEHRDEYDKLNDLIFVGEGGIDCSESWKYYKSISLHKCFGEIIKYQQTAIELYKKNHSVENRNYADACKRLADYYAREIGLLPMTQMIFIHPELNDLAFEELKNQKDKAEQYYTIALNYYKNYDDFDAASRVLESLHYLYEFVMDDAKSASALTESFELWKKEIIKQFSMMTSEEKEQIVFDNYWESQIEHYNYIAYMKSMISSTDSRYAELSYDVQLLSKGLLLKSEIGLRDLINESGNTELINNYEKLSVFQKRISDAEDEATIKSLRDEYNKLERKLLKESELFGNYLQDFSFTFKDVRSNLRDKDIAIEFSTIRTADRDENGDFKWTHSYFALVLKNSYSSPKIIHLANKINIDSLYYSVWEPLMEEIQGMENVYFSPAYDLNNMPLESVQLPNGTYISDIGINFYRVSSTREIINSRNDKSYDNMVLYGGLQYNADVEDMIKSDAEERTRGLRGSYSLADDIKRDLQNGARLWKYLPGTLKEISDISSLASSKGIKAKSYTSTKGTESTFKNFSKKEVSIIHIATHGFYIPTHDNISEETMKRSGLAFAGANNIARGVILPEELDDGILTADEISKLDFRNVSLVVLSACDTGLGKVTGEGVFGLQRGFKKAGVESLLMSLWPVDDEATQMLMVEFYKQLLSGKTKCQALRNAQQVVRSTEGFENSEYWAGFILLDGLK